MAKRYYETFQRLMKENPTKELKIAVIYSYAANEEEPDNVYQCDFRPQTADMVAETKANYGEKKEDGES